MNKDIKNIFYRYVEYYGYKIFTPVRLALELLMRSFNSVLVYRVQGSSYGDSLAISAVIAELSRTKAIKAIVLSKTPWLFNGNPRVILNLDYNVLPKLVRSLIKKIAKYSRGKYVICVGQERWVLDSNPKEAFSVNKLAGRYLTNMVPDLLNNGFSIKEDIVPELYFDLCELDEYKKKYSWLPAKFATIKATVGNARVSSMMLKEWGYEKMQAVAIHPDLKSIQWVQIGEKAEPLISGSIDMTGIPIKEALFLISRSLFVLTTEGFISHAAAGLNTPAVVVFSGRPPISYLEYPSTIAIRANQLPSCSPCMAEHCYMQEKICTEQITVQQVVEVIYENFKPL